MEVAKQVHSRGLDRRFRSSMRSRNICNPPVTTCTLPHLKSVKMIWNPEKLILWCVFSPQKVFIPKICQDPERFILSCACFSPSDCFSTASYKRDDSLQPVTAAPCHTGQSVTSWVVTSLQTETDQENRHLSHRAVSYLSWVVTSLQRLTERTGTCHPGQPVSSLEWSLHYKQRLYERTSTFPLPCLSPSNPSPFLVYHHPTLLSSMFYHHPTLLSSLISIQHTHTHTPFLSGHLEPSPFCAPDRRFWHQESSAAGPPGRTGSSECLSPAPDSPRQTHRSALPHCGICCLADWQSSSPWRPLACNDKQGRQ